MLHIYRQITSLKRVSPFVIAQKREEAARYPFERIAVVGKPARHFLRRFWFKQLRDAPWQVSGDRKSTRLNSSHSQISYAVFCLKKKKKKTPFPNSQRLRTRTRTAAYTAAT